MWILFTPVLLPGAPYWPGRRWLVALDAIAWPAGWALVVAQAPKPMGIVGLVITGERRAVRREPTSTGLATQ